MSETQQLTEHQRAAMVARFVEMQDISMLAVNAKLLAPRDEVMSFSHWKYQWEKKTHFQYHEEQKLLTVFVDLDATLSGMADEKARAFANCSAVYCVTYLFNVVGGPPAEERDAFFLAFANINGVFNAWPFFRELVHSTMGRMGLLPISLPVYRITPPPQKEAAPKVEQPRVAQLEKKTKASKPKHVKTT